MYKIAGPAQDMEVALSSLVHGKLEDTVPGLMQHLVGFQTLDTDEEKARAIGLAGFKIRDNWLYVPAFYINGQIKGMDMMYSRKANLFVPLKDNWVGYLLSKEPGNLGKIENKNETDLHLLAPDFITAYTGGGIGRAKGASDLSSLAGGISPEVAEKMLLATKAAAFDLNYWCDKIPHFAAVLAKTASDNPSFKAALTTYYRPDELFSNTEKAAAAVERARKARIASMPKRAAARSLAEIARMADYDAEAKAGGVVKVALDNLSVFSSDLSEYQKSRVYAGGTVYLDTRKSANLALREKAGAEVKPGDREPGIRVREIKPAQTVNLAMPGDYDVLLANGDTKTLFIAPHIRPLCFPRYSKDKTFASGSLVFDKEIGEGRVMLTDKLVCLPPRNGLGLGDTLKNKAIELSSMRPGLMYSLIFPDGTMSNAFQCGGKKEGDTATTYQVRYDDKVYAPAGEKQEEYEYMYCPGSTPCHFYLPKKPDSSELSITPCGSEEEHFEYKGVTYNVSKDTLYWNGSKNLCTIVQRTRDKTSPVVRNTTAIVGRDVKAIELGKPLGWSTTGDDKFPALGGPEIMWNTAFNVEDSTVMRIKKASNDVVAMHEDGSRFSGTKSAFVDYLIFEVGLREKQARQVLETLETSGDFDITIVKNAAPHPGNPDGNKDLGSPWPVNFPSSFSDYLGRSAQEPHEMSVGVPGASSQARMDYPYSVFEDSEVKNVLRAAETGNKDVFDVSVVKGLVKTFDISSVIDEYLPDLIKAVDRLGRLRFIAFWHLDKLEERFGQQELVDLENSMKNDFESLGDTVLFLQRKVTDADPARMIVDSGKLDASM